MRSTRPAGSFLRDLSWARHTVRSTMTRSMLAFALAAWLEACCLALAVMVAL
jgi:hypothetical protein